MLRTIGRFLYGAGFIVSVSVGALIAKLLRHPSYEATAQIIWEDDEPSKPSS